MGQDAEQLKRDIEQTRSKMATDVDALTEKVTPSKVVERRVERTKASVAGLKEKVMGTTSDKASSAGSGVSGTGHAVTDKVSSSASGVADSTTDAASSVKQSALGNPLAAGVVAFGVGWLVSSLLPASEKETQAASRLTEVAKEHAEPVKQELAGIASDMKDELREPAQEAVESVKSTATDSASQVKESAKSGS